MAETGPNSFFFLFRTDKGRIDRATWWRGSLPIAAIALIGTGAWLELRPYARHDLTEQPFIAPMTILAYSYLLVYAFALILLAICEYNLSAKRFRDRGRPGALAGLLPLSLLLGSAVLWFIPRSFGSVPEWIGPIIFAIMALALAWNVVELGVVTGRRAL